MAANKIIIKKFPLPLQRRMWYNHIMTVTKDKSGITVDGAEFFNVKDTLECGQIFRFAYDGGGYTVRSADKYCRIVQTADGVRIDTSDPEYFYNYFALDADYSEYYKRLHSFPELVRESEAGKGIRLLRQNAFEMIISFIISANNNIPRIKGIIERLCAAAGKITPDGGHAFPTREELLPLSVADYAALGAGYRDTYLYSAVRTVTDGFVSDVKSLSTDEARKKLLTVKGIGPKVADCIVLFGLSRWDSFPVDTWMKQALMTEELDTPVKIHDFYMSRYGELAGLAQQYIFHYARNVDTAVR